MKNNLKYIILGIAAVICVSIYIYYNPYHSCLRGLKLEGWDLEARIIKCLKAKY